MKNWVIVIALGMLLGGFALGESGGQEKGTPKRILVERGEKVQGQRLKLVKKVIESYNGCRVISDGKQLTALVINEKTYQDFTIVIRDAKKTIIVVTADGVVTFDF